MKPPLFVPLFLTSLFSIVIAPRYDSDRAAIAQRNNLVRPFWTRVRCRIDAMIARDEHWSHQFARMGSTDPRETHHALRLLLRSSLSVSLSFFFSSSSAGPSRRSSFCVLRLSLPPSTTLYCIPRPA